MMLMLYRTGISLMLMMMMMMLSEIHALHCESLSPAATKSARFQISLRPSMVYAFPAPTGLLRCYGGGDEGESQQMDVQELCDDDISDEVGVKPSIRGAFGARFDSELKAAIFNLAVTVALVVFLSGARNALSEAIENPVWVDAFCRVLGGCALIQVPMVAMLARREIITYGAEAFFKRADVIWGVRAGGLLSLFFALMKAHDLLDLGAAELEKQMESMGMQDRAVNNADDDGDGDGDGGIAGDMAGDMAAAATTMMSGDENANDAATPMKLRGSSNAAEEMADEAVGAPPQPNWWEVALEGMFKMTGNDLALQGLRVSRGETLTEDEKMRIRELEQAQEATGGDVLQAPEAREEALSVHSETRAAQGGDHARPPLREEQEDDRPPALREGASSIVGADEGEEEANVAADQGSRFDFGGGRGMKKEPPSVVNMLPAALRPFAWPILLLFSLFTLCKQVIGLGETSWTRMNELEADVTLPEGKKRADVLASLVTTAFEEAGIRRDHFIKTLSAALSAIGGAQGMMGVMRPDEATMAATPWLTSPLARRISMHNGYMVWIMLSTALRSIGQFDSSAIFYLGRPDDLSSWGQRGVVSGRVSAYLDKGGTYRLASVARLSDGQRVTHEQSFDLSEFEGKAKGKSRTKGKGGFRQADFVNAVRSSFIDSAPWKSTDIWQSSDGAPKTRGRRQTTQ